ncbi:hypothetical protein WDV93_16350 [Pantoea ananatis]
MINVSEVVVGNLSLDFSSEDFKPLAAYAARNPEALYWSAAPAGAGKPAPRAVRLAICIP